MLKQNILSKKNENSGISNEMNDGTKIPRNRTYYIV